MEIRSDCVCGFYEEAREVRERVVSRERMKKKRNDRKKARTGGVKEIEVVGCDMALRNAPTGNQITRSQLQLHPVYKVESGGFRHHRTPEKDTKGNSLRWEIAGGEEGKRTNGVERTERLEEEERVNQWERVVGRWSEAPGKYQVPWPVGECGRVWARDTGSQYLVLQWPTARYS